MERQRRDPGADTLLDLDGQVFVVDAKGDFTVRFSVRRAAANARRSAGLAYSLTLHDRSGARVVGFDNAHSVRKSRNPGGKGLEAFDHSHFGGQARPYRFRDAATLLADFWSAVDRYLLQRGVDV